MAGLRIVVVVYDGVLDDECQAFRSVLGLLSDAIVVFAGKQAGSYSGPGGTQIAEIGFAAVPDADVVVVPGGLGCERAADDPSLREFLLRMEKTARYLAASSTGTVVLASAGLLHGEPAATHWLAGDLLRRYGSETAGRRLVVADNVITCEGRISAVDAAFALVERLEGCAAIDRIRSTLIERGEPLLRQPGRLERLVVRFRRRRPNGPTAPDPHSGGPMIPPVTPLSVMVELVDNDELTRRMKRSTHHRNRRIRSVP